jgi:membrane-associated protease RseP (regulator of RpoE activity)
MNGGNGQSTAETVTRPPVTSTHVRVPRRRWTTWVALLLFLLTVISTLAVGAQFAQDYANDRASSILDANPYADMWRNPGLLLLGIPFSFTLLGILLAHELGHYFACRYYGISASYPYFIPAPTLIGTMGAFIRIRSPIVNRKALFDVGLAGPVVGFIFAVPALALAILYSKRIPAEQVQSAIVFGNPLLSHMLAAVLRPSVPIQDIFLHPVGRAAWVGLFATALNLLPAGQLDGGHVVYAVSPDRHRRISLMVVAALLLLGTPPTLYLLGLPMPAFLARLWPGWAIWGALLTLFGFRHPRLVDPWESLDGKRRTWAAIAWLIFLLCFSPVPISLN